MIQGVEAGWHGVIDLNDSHANLLGTIKSSLAEGRSKNLLAREYPIGDSVAAYELVTTCLRGESVDKKLNAIKGGLTK